MVGTGQIHIGTVDTSSVHMRTGSSGPMPRQTVHSHVFICLASGLRGFLRHCVFILTLDLCKFMAQPNTPISPHGGLWEILRSIDLMLSMDVAHTQGHLSNSGAVLWLQHQ